MSFFIFHLFHVDAAIVAMRAEPLDPNDSFLEVDCHHEPVAVADRESLQGEGDRGKELSCNQDARGQIPPDTPGIHSLTVTYCAQWPFSAAKSSHYARQLRSVGLKSRRRLWGRFGDDNTWV